VFDPGLMQGGFVELITGRNCHHVAADDSGP
jgi:hypothetical protein